MGETTQARRVRLLPWPAPDGKPAYVEDASGFIDSLADDVETMQLEMGADLLRRVEDLVHTPDGDRMARELAPSELQFVVARLSEALSDALRVAQSRGLRLDRDDERAAAADESETAMVVRQLYSPASQGA